MLSCDCVDEDLLVIKAIFFFFYCGTSCIYPYMFVYMKQSGLMASQIGVIKSTGNCMMVFIKPVLASIADKTRRPKSVAVMTVMAASALHISMLFIPPVPPTAALQPSREQRHPAETDKQDRDADNSESWLSLTFWLFFGIFLICHGLHWSLTSQVEAATYQIIKKNKRGEFGRQRVFGSMGFALFGLVSGVAMDAVTDRTSPENPGNETSPAILGNKTDYSVAFYMFLAFMVLTVACLLALKDWSTELTDPSTEFLEDVGRLISQLHLITVLFAVFLLGVYDGASRIFLFLHLKDLGASQTVLGTYLFVKKAAEIPGYVISGWIIRKLGHGVVLGGSFVAFGVRLLLYSFVSNPWWAVAIDTLNGCQAVMWAAVTSYASSSAQDNLQTVAQAIVATTFFGIGDPLGNLVGGLLFDRYGAVVSFRTLAVSCLIGFLLFFILHNIMCFGKHDNPTERQLGTGEENETKIPFVPASAEGESAALKPGSFLRGGSVTNRAGEHIGFLRIVKPQNSAW